MKNKILAMLVAFGLVGSVSAIEVNENLSINGFIDGSLSQTDNDATGKDGSLGLDEVEVNFLFNVGSVSGELHVDSAPSGGTLSNDGSLNIEQAHFTYSLENGISVTVGRYGSALGLEREDPAGLYTVSRAYSTDFNLGDINNNAKEGLTVSYAAEAWTLGVSIENPAGTIRSGGTKNDLDFEVALTYTGIENLNVGLGYFKDNQAVAANETDVTNIHATYQVGKALLGAEFTQADTATVDLDATMFLVDYDVSDKLGVAVRYSQWATTSALDSDTITIAPNYAITESLGAILEYSSTDVDVAAGAASQDSDLIALELTYTF